VARRNSTFLAELGPGGLSSLALALATGALGLGLPIALRARRVLAAAAGEPPAVADAVLVLGRELVDDRLTAAFEARLEHALELLRGGWAPRLLISGGMTGAATRSEAAAGRDFLRARGVPSEQIWIEESSRFTLENLVNVRVTLRARGLRRVIVVSDPLHLARAATMASGLGLDFRCSAAVAAPPVRRSVAWWLRLLREAFLLHWYHVGIAYSRAIGSQKLLSRVR
jgi:uncharacterized SAM-binding protein YcdF (DUF218 family)